MINRVRRSVPVILVLLVIISFNTFINALTERFDWKGDLTEGQLFHLSDTTKEILKNLEEPVTITCFDREDGADTNITELLKRYDKTGGMVNVRHVDLEANPSLVSTYAKKGISLTANGILVESGTNAAAFPWNEMYGYNTYSDADGNTRYTLTSFKAEKKITSAIVQVTDGKQRSVLFTQGHSENITDGLTELISDSNYKVQTSVLGLAGLEGVSTVIIAGPARDFSAEEIEGLDAFLSNGGSLMVFRNPGAGSLPNLDGYLAEWGLAVDRTVVMEPSRQMDSPMYVIPDFSVHMMNVWFSENSSYVVLPVCGSITLSSPNGRLTSPVLKSTSESYAKPLMDAETTERENGDPSGPFILAATSEMRTGKDTEGEIPKEESGQPKAYVFLADCSHFYADSYLQNASLGNGQLVLQALSYMNDESVSLSIPEKSLSNRQIALTWSQTVTFGVIFLGLIPLALVLSGLAVFIRRRRA